MDSVNQKSNFDPKKYSWVEAAQHLQHQGEAYVLVTLIGVSGSTPRNSGTKMVVSADNCFDTIGGGHLEHKVIAYAHKMLAEQTDFQHIEHFQLTAQLGQCCGGTTTVLFEYFAANAVNIMLFGAGHVGQALVNILSALPCKVTWVDSREGQFPALVNQSIAGSLSNIVPVVNDCPEMEVAKMPANSYYIVMTHNHQLDFKICRKILKRGDFHYLGLIASKTKWRRFQQRFNHREIDPVLVERMNCPIGLDEVPGKAPMEVAVSVAAEIIALYQKDTPVGQGGKRQGVSWNQLKTEMKLE